MKHLHTVLLRRIALFVVLLALLVAGPWYGARKTVQAMQARQQASGLMLNLAYWSVLLPGFERLLDLPSTQQAVLWHQLRDGVEFADEAELQERSAHLLERLQPWTQQAVLRDDGRIAPQAFDAHLQALGALVRRPWPAQQEALVAAMAHRLGAALQHEAARTLSQWQQFEAAQTLAMLAARQHDQAALQHWKQAAERILPQPGDITTHTVANTALHLLPLHITLASCVPGQTPLGLEASRAALRTGYDVRQLRQQYAAAWDRALLLWAQQKGNAPECAQLAGQYLQLLIAKQPDT